MEPHSFETFAHSLGINEEGARQRRTFHISNALWNNLERVSTYFRLAPSHGNSTVHAAAVTAVADGSIFRKIWGMHNACTMWLQTTLANYTARLATAEQQVATLRVEGAAQHATLKQAAADNEELQRQLRKVSLGPSQVDVCAVTNCSEVLDHNCMHHSITIKNKYICK